MVELFLSLLGQTVAFELFAIPALSFRFLRAVLGRVRIVGLPALRAAEFVDFSFRDVPALTAPHAQAGLLQFAVCGEPRQGRDHGCFVHLNGRAAVRNLNGAPAHVLGDCRKEPDVGVEIPGEDRLKEPDVGVEIPGEDRLKDIPREQPVNRIVALPEPRVEFSAFRCLSNILLDGGVCRPFPLARASRLCRRSKPSIFPSSSSSCRTASTRRYCAVPFVAFSHCQGKVEMSYSLQSRNVRFCGAGERVRVILTMPVKRRRAMLASNPIEE